MTANPWSALQRWRVVRGVPPFTTNAAEGSLVRLTGVVSAVDDTIIAPLADVASVVVWTRLRAARPFETTRVCPFHVSKGALRVLIDTENLRLLRPSRRRGTMDETNLGVGERITVVGCVVHDGVEPPDEELPFREAQPACKLVGSRGRPVLIVDA